MRLTKVVSPSSPACKDGVIDTGADIVIMGQELFARVAATERLHKKSLGSQTECHGLMTERDSSG